MTWSRARLVLEIMVSMLARTLFVLGMMFLMLSLGSVLAPTLDGSIRNARLPAIDFGTVMFAFAWAVYREWKSKAMTAILNNVLAFAILFGAVLFTQVGGSLLTKESDGKKGIGASRRICLILAVVLFFSAIRWMP